MTILSAENPGCHRFS